MTISSSSRNFSGLAPNVNLPKRHCPENKTVCLKDIFKKRELSLVITKFLTPAEVARIARVSKLFQTKSHEQFRLYLRVESPIKTFIEHPELREQYVTCDAQGEKHVQELINVHFGDSLPVPKNFTTSNFTATRINALIQNLAKAREQKKQELAYANLTDLQINISIARPNFSIDQIKLLSNVETTVVFARPDLSFDQIRSLYHY